MSGKIKLSERFQRFRQRLRLFSYLFLLVMLLFLLILYMLYLSAQRKPAFYKDELSTPLLTSQRRNDDMLKSINRVHNGIQSVVKKEKKSWGGKFTADELNGYFAVEAVKPGANIIPAVIKEPRLTISPQKCNLAFLIERDGFGGVLHFTFSIQMPEPNRLMLRIKNAHIGTIPVSRNYIVTLLHDTLKQKGTDATVGNEAGDPTLSFPLDFKFKNDTLVIETLEIEDGALSFTGSILAKKPL